MGELIDLAMAREERLPHLSGPAICLQCKHTWVAVVPLGTVNLECPKCRLLYGIFSQMIERSENHFKCDCGSFHFLIGEQSGVYCPNCGVKHTF